MHVASDCPYVFQPVPMYGTVAHSSDPYWDETGMALEDQFSTQHPVSNGGIDPILKFLVLKSLRQEMARTNQQIPEVFYGFLPQTSDSDPATASAMHFTRVARATRCASLPEAASPKSRHSCILQCSNSWQIQEMLGNKLVPDHIMPKQ